MKDIAFRRPPGDQNKKALSKFFERNNTEAWLPILLRAEQGVDNVVHCFGGFYGMKKPPPSNPLNQHTPVLTFSVVMERCPMTLRDWLKSHPSLSVSTYNYSLLASASSALLSVLT